MINLTNIYIVKPLRDCLYAMVLQETIALEYYAMIQEMFNGYFSSPAYAGKNFIAKIADHEEKLAQMLDILLYGLAKKE